MRRSIRTIYFSSHFAKALKKLPADIAGIVSEREKFFKQNCFDSRLKTHKLKGKSREFWSFSLTHSHRVVFRFLADDSVLFIDVGSHSIYK